MGGRTQIRRPPRRRVNCGTQGGYLLDWRGRFGWIWPDHCIEHPEAERHGGRVYVSIDDVVHGSELRPGARVWFEVYSDGDGIGAESVQPEQEEQEGEEIEPWKRPTQSAGSWRRSTWQAATPTRMVYRTINKWNVWTKQQGAKGGKGSSTWQDRGKGAGNHAPSNSKEAPWRWASEGRGGKGGHGKAASFEPKARPCVLQPAPGPDRSKHVSQGSQGPLTTALTWAKAEMRGWRPAMEDAGIALLSLDEPFSDFALFAVFDGHGGAAVSSRAAQEMPDHLVSCALDLISEQGPRSDDGAPFAAQVLELALPSWDLLLRAEGDGKPGFLRSAAGPPIPSDVFNEFGLTGSTAVMAMIQCEASVPRRVVVANLGDSRALLCRAGAALPLSEDHKPELPAETDRIVKAGGSVSLVGPCHRLDGWGLNLSRALGDFHYKAREDLPPGEQKVSNNPDVQIFELTEDDEFLLLGCDGVFELHSDQGAIDHIRAALAEGKELEQVVTDFVDSCCSPNLSKTMGQGGDNVSAIVVLLR